MVHNSCLSTIGNDGFECSVGKNSILTETGDTSTTKSSDIPGLDSGSSSNKIVTWSEFVVSIDSACIIKYDGMSSEGGTAEGLVSVSKSKMPVELENGKVGQPSGKL